MLARVLLALALALGPAAGEAETGPAPKLRGPVRPAAAAPIASPMPAQAVATPDADSRMAGPGPIGQADPGDKIDGGDCRMSCARDLYMCRVERDATDCNPAWIRCVASCPEATSSLP